MKQPFVAIVICLVFFITTNTSYAATTPIEPPVDTPTATPTETTTPSPTTTPTATPTETTTPSPTTTPTATPTKKPTPTPTPKPTTKIYSLKYGVSGRGKALWVHKFLVPKATRKVLIVFELHGYEDSYAKDGQILVNIGKKVVAYFKKYRRDLRRTSLYVVCKANPDGLALGWTNNGPGRCQISGGIDLNRDFGYRWIYHSNARNKTLSPFSAPESRALRDLVKNIKPEDVIDIHGWLATSFGTSSLCQQFNRTLNIRRSGGLNGAAGYFAAWALSKPYVKRACLVELRSTYTKASSIISALKSICRDG